MNYKSIFIFEHKAPVANVLKSILIDEGYTVRTSNSTNFLIEKLKEFKPNLIIITRHIPPLGAVKAIKIIRQNSIIPIVFISVSATLEQAKESGADAFISKPIDINKLLLTVKTFANLN